jgi:TolB-like protein
MGAPTTWSGSESVVVERNGRLDSWKEIAAYLKRDITTVQRWERREGLPVHRHLHERRGSVYGYETELNAWLDGRRTQAAVSKRGWERLILPVVSLVALATATVIYGLRPGVVGEERGRAASLAVLPFENVGRNPDREYLSDWLTEGLIDRLSRLDGLKVISRASIFPYKGQRMDLSAIRRDLNVRAVVVGNVEHRGEELWISAELVDVRDGGHLWGGQYHRRLADIGVLEEEIARDVARTVRVEWGLGGSVAAAASPQRTGAAHHAYLRGRFHWNKRTPEGFRHAIEEFRAALAADPNYALPYAGLADTYILAGYSRFLPATESHAQARAAASKALELDDTIAEAHVTVARLRSIDWDWSGAERAFRRAIELNPNCAPARHWYANHLTNMGRHDEAIREAQTAVELDPLSAAVNSGALGAAYLFAGRYEEANAQYRKTLELDPNFAAAHALLGMTYIRQHLHREALVELGRALALIDAPGWQAHVAYVHAVMGRRAEARALLNRLEPPRYVSSVVVAGVHAALGENDRAFALLEQAYAQREPELSEIRTHLVFDSLHHDPRFVRILHRMNLPM